MAQLPSQSQFGDYGEWPGRDVLDSGGERLGGVREIYLDRETGRPEWVLVDIVDDEARFVPLADASVSSSQIRVAHTAEAIRSAPGIGSEPRIDQSEERRLYDHYGLGYAEEGSGLPEPERAGGPTPGAWGSEEPARDPWAEEAEPEEAPSWSAAAPAEPVAAEALAALDAAPAEELVAPPAPDDPVSAEELAAQPVPVPAAPVEAADLKAQPGPDAVRATEPPPRNHAVPPPPEDSSDPRRNVAIGVAAALILLFILRRRR